MSSLNCPLVVYKLGGSLLDWSGLPDALDWLCSRRPDAATLLVVGGGETADVVRRWDEVFHLGEERAHWLALESLALNEQLLQTLWPALRPVRSLTQVVSAANERVPAIVCASCFVRWGEKTGAPELPHNWQVTTDSIAAWIADVVSADELVLLKSTSLPPATTLQNASDAGLVDGYFPQAVVRVPRVTWVNLRASPVVSGETEWLFQPRREEQD
ncbi:MAG: uridylate kinase [Planctomycetota bacterium]|nr:uridylate kinase [Planctomycetota bacterium]